MKYTFNHGDMLQNSMNEIVTKAVINLAEQKEKYILQQLSELVSRGLIVIEETQPILVRGVQLVDQTTIELRMEQSVRLVPKEFEYIKKLEKENEELKAKLTLIEEAFKNGQP
jgi:hypothetical protein